MSDEVSADRAAINALAFLKHSQRTVGLVPSGFPPLAECALGADATSVFDLDGIELFYEFPLIQGASTVGSVRTAATRLLGHPWISIQNQPPYNVQDVAARANQRVSVEFPGFSISDQKLVAFNYPRVGMLLQLVGAGGQAIARIFDPEFPDSPLLALPEGGTADRTEGLRLHSVLDTLPEGGALEPSQIFDHADSILQGLINAGAKRAGIPSPPLNDLHHIERALAAGLDNQPEGLGAPVEKVLDVPLILQEKSDFCVLASIAMMLKFHGIDSPADQEGILQVLTTSPSLYSIGGVVPDMQVEAFQRCFPATGFNFSWDGVPTWDKGREIIDSGRPIKSGIFGHSRVAVGYQAAGISSTEPTPVLEIQRYLWINDPSSSVVRRELYETLVPDPDNPDGWVTHPGIPPKTNYLNVTRADA